MSLDADPLAHALAQSLGAGYRLERMVGHGGFGQVYRGYDVRLDRAVAIKVLRPEMATAPEFLERFHREGVALAKLRHPAIVPIYDLREEGDLVYLIMPFIEGETLRSRMARRGTVPPKEAHRILLELCDALAAAHRAGIVHRDIKPDNVILEGTLRKVLLLDFGIAALRGDVDAEDAPQVGTPLYMSPEQVAGDTVPDHRTDLYALGVLGYQLLCGSPPFVASDAGGVMALHLTGRVVPIRERNPSVPPPMARVLEACLAKRAADRPAEALDVARELQRCEFFPTLIAEPTDVPLVTPNSWLFGWAAVLALLAGQTGGGSLAELSASSWYTIATAFAGLAAATSPRARRWIRDEVLSALPGRRQQPVESLPSTTSTELAVPEELSPDTAALFDGLTPVTRQRLADVPGVVRRLENGALALRARIQALDSALETPDAAAGVREERESLQGRLDTAQAILEALRMDLLSLTAGVETPGVVTDAVVRANEFHAEVDRMIEARREVRRLTGEHSA